MIRRVPKYPWQWNPWPLTRLVIILALLALQAHLCGWAVPWADILAFPGRFVIVVVSLFLLAGSWAFLYFFLWMLPIILILLLNDWLYGGSRWILQELFKLRSRYLLAGASVCMEAGVLVGGFFLLQRYFVAF